MYIIQEEEIKDLIGEATEYDKKEKLEEKDPRSWCKSVSAFANGIGGSLIFGIVDKTNEVVGLSDAEGDSEKISRILRDKMDPVPEFVLRFAMVDGMNLIVLEIHPGIETPYYYVGRNERTAYYRVGNESVICDAIKLHELTLKGSGRSYDSLSSGYKLSDMSFSKLKSVYFQRSKKKFEDSDYSSFGIVGDNGILTNAGALLADESPIRHSRIFCTRWNGLTKAPSRQDALDDDELSGSLVSLLQDGEAFVKRNSHKGWFKASDRRIELPDYPERAVTEGIVNALIHRNYMEVGSEVHIDIFDDRMEIYSPGGMYDGINVQDRDIMAVPSRRRNPIIADIFSRLIYMERRGSGFKKIIEDYQAQHKYVDSKMPKFISQYDAFFLTLWNLNYKDGNGYGNGRGNGSGNSHGNGSGNDVGSTEEDNSSRVYGIEIKQRADAVADYLRDNPEASISDTAKYLELSRKKVVAAIDYLKENNRIFYEGTNRKGHWIVRG